MSTDDLSAPDFFAFIVVILAPRDEAVDVCTQFGLASDGPQQRHRGGPSLAVAEIGGISVVCSRSRHVIRTDSSRGARMTTLVDTQFK